MSSRAVCAESRTAFRVHASIQTFMEALPNELLRSQDPLDLDVKSQAISPREVNTRSDSGVLREVNHPLYVEHGPTHGHPPDLLPTGEYLVQSLPLRRSGSSADGEGASTRTRKPEPRDIRESYDECHLLRLAPKSNVDTRSQRSHLRVNFRELLRSPSLKRTVILPNQAIPEPRTTKLQNKKERKNASTQASENDIHTLIVTFKEEKKTSPSNCSKSRECSTCRARRASSRLLRPCQPGLLLLQNLHPDAS